MPSWHGNWVVWSLFRVQTNQIIHINKLKVLVWGANPLKPFLYGVSVLKQPRAHFYWQMYSCAVYRIIQRCFLWCAGFWYPFLAVIRVGFTHDSGGYNSFWKHKHKWLEWNAQCITMLKNINQYLVILVFHSNCLGN